MESSKAFIVVVESWQMLDARDGLVGRMSYTGKCFASL